MEGKRKKYDRTFKLNAVISSYENPNLSKLANEIGVDSSLLTRWRQEYQEFGNGCFLGSGNVRVHPEEEKIVELEKRLKESVLRFEILKDGIKHLLKGDIAIFQFIKDNEKKHTITRMCKVLGVGEGKYRRWKNSGISNKQKQIILLKEKISSIFYNFKKHYGRFKIAKELHAIGYKISDAQVGFYMKQLNLKYKPIRRFKITTDSKHNYYTSSNVLDRKFKISKPSKVWVSDITYIQIHKGFMYLTIIMDLYDRKVIGWSLSSRLTTQKTTLAAWEMAIINRKVLDGLVFHSDRGVQYANKIFTEELDSYNCVRSMSRKSNSLDNAVAESFFCTLKREFIYKQNKLLKKGQIKKEMFEFIENWYNKQRIHSTLNYKTIEEFNAIDKFKS
ncbi:IS3 family transposase [Flavobacterium sp. LHD-80]|uniref:IS3 family transposase n=1 Tax=Flavobacterium sp. LHD-80 TaxID=3071411 RepID=UPI0027E086DC|nr:IS3 family transposase [Flavobacterium sp. LHD-80]MDQ6470129.1 IS3 family transposase [Flavobacterium sp. LHD-80]